MHSSIIDEAMARARGRLGTEKTASAGEQGLVKEAEDLAEALEFIALASVDDSSAAGDAGRSLLGTFFKEAARGGPAETVTQGGGTQPPVPSHGKAHIPTEGTGARPSESVATAGKLSREAMAMQPPGVTTSPTASKKAGVTTLFDLLEGEKLAARGSGPADSVALDNQASPPARQENANIHLLRSNAAPVAATKRQAKAPTRDRLAQLWAGAGDTVGDATAQAIWPQAASKGSLKVAFGPGKHESQVNKEQNRQIMFGKNPADHANRASLTGTRAAQGALHGALGGTLGGAGYGGLVGAGLGAGGGLVHGLASGSGLRGTLGHLASGAAQGGLAGSTLGGAAGAAVGGIGGAISGGIGGHQEGTKYNKARRAAMKKDEAEKKGSRYDRGDRNAAIGAGIGTAIPRIYGTGQIGAAIGAKDGRRAAAAVGSGLGSLAGHVGGHVLTGGSLLGHDLGGIAGSALGAAEGSRRARLSSEKKGSAAEYAQLFDALLDGAAGEDAQSFAQYIEGQG